MTKDLDRSGAVIDAVRLTKAGTPRLHCYAQIQMSRFPLHDPLSFTHENGTMTLDEQETQIEKTDLCHIKKVWNNLMGSKYAEPWPNLTKPNQLDVAFSGFSRSYELRSWLDNIVDLTISLESLFGPKDDKELSHRISLRAAWLLSPAIQRKNPKTLENKIYKCVRTIYDIRSHRVHGDIPSESDIHKWIRTLSGSNFEKGDRHAERVLLEPALEAARAIVRTAIRACMELNKLNKTDGPRWPLPRDFDQNLLLPGQQKVWQKAAQIIPLNW